MNDIISDETISNLLTIFSRLDDCHKRLALTLINGILVLQNSSQRSDSDDSLTDFAFEPRQDDYFDGSDFGKSGTLRV